MQVLRIVSCSDRYLQQLFLNVCLNRSHTCKQCVLCTKQCGLHSELICTETVFKGLISYSVLGSSVINRGDPCRTREAHTHTHTSSCAHLAPECLFQSLSAHSWHNSVGALAHLLHRYWSCLQRLSVSLFTVFLWQMKKKDEKVVIKESMMEMKGIAGAG